MGGGYFATSSISQGEEMMADPIPAQKAPYGTPVAEGTEYYWCACGRSASQPFCDGSHKGTGLSPMAFKAAKTEEAWLCGCKASSNKPFCDGSHRKLP
jgi:CDGSH-type Zn-finger protein